MKCNRLRHYCHVFLFHCSHCYCYLQQCRCCGGIAQWQLYCSVARKIELHDSTFFGIKAVITMALQVCNCCQNHPHNNYHNRHLFLTRDEATLYDNVSIINILVIARPWLVIMPLCNRVVTISLPRRIALPSKRAPKYTILGY